MVQLKLPKKESWLWETSPLWLKIPHHGHFLCGLVHFSRYWSYFRLRYNLTLLTTLKGSKQFFFNLVASLELIFVF